MKKLLEEEGVMERVGLMTLEYSRPSRKRADCVSVNS